MTDKQRQHTEDTCRRLLQLHVNPGTANEWYTVLEAANLLKYLGAFTPEDRDAVDDIRERYDSKRYHAVPGGEDR
jgi:hypothetical protein